MTEQEKYLNRILLRIVSELDISDTMREKAKNSYEAVGKWLGNSDEYSDVKVMPQGSFNLGTVIKPVSDKDEYDIDLVCLLQEDSDKDENYIKNVVGDRLKNHKTYADMLEDEGKRCWTLNYNEFHMDILPCVPKYKIYKEPILTDIRLTHKVGEGAYIPKYSNPYKYREWFEERMEKKVHEMRAKYSDEKNVEIDKIPIFLIKTPLQQVVQLLKRHRDITYDSLQKSRKENAPISIIITTLAAHAYNDEGSLYEALKNIVMKMDNYIVKDEGVYKIMNPVLEDENFADKWNENPLKVKEFYYWLNAVKKDVLEKPFELEGLHNVSYSLEQCFGKNIVQRALKDEGEETRKLRETDSLYIDGLKGGLKTEASKTTKPVKGHTFFGKELH